MRAATVILIAALMACVQMAQPFPVMQAKGADSSKCPFSSPSATDMLRASSSDARRMGGRTFTDMASKINAHLVAQGTVLKECREFELPALDDLVRQMWCHLSEDLHSVYKAHGGDLRKLRFSSLEEFERHWAQVNSAAEADGADAVHALKEAKCAEALMLYTHHVPEEAKALLKASAMPTMPAYRPEAARHATVGKAYTESYTCVSGHNMTANHTSDHILPHWPAEVHYHALGHGAYPFWLGGGGSGGSGAKIEAWWSEPKASEKLYHASCDLSEMGYSKKSSGPCIHLFVGVQPSPKAYMYTPELDFCCTSEPGPDTHRPLPARVMRRPMPPQLSSATRRLLQPPGGQTMMLSTVTSDFMDIFTYKGTGDFKGTYYTGTIKKYLLGPLSSSQPVSYFWYYTTPDGRPVEQGEGGDGSPGGGGPDRRLLQGGGKGIVVYHEYNTTSFESAKLDASEFAVPDICKSTTTSCSFP